ENAARWRPGSIEFVKNREQLTAMLPAHPAQDRHQAERHAALLVSIIHVVQKEAIKFVDLTANSIEPPNFKIPNARRRGTIGRRENCRALELVSEFRGQSQRIIADSVESARHSGHDLKNCFQHSSKKTNIFDLVIQIGIAHADLLGRTTGNDHSFPYV